MDRQTDRKTKDFKLANARVAGDGGSIKNIWVWGGQGRFCLQGLHWPDTSPRFSLASTDGGRREGSGVRGELPEGSREPKMFYTKTMDITDKIQH